MDTQVGIQTLDTQVKLQDHGCDQLTRTIEEESILINDKWINMCILLNKFGVNYDKSALHLNWDTPDSNQFRFLLKLIGKLSNSNVKGDYDHYNKFWSIRHSG
ncbi:MAG: hypothetical protein ACW98A_16865 [Candidatus Hodarchaeales archaeon]